MTMLYFHNHRGEIQRTIYNVTALMCLTYTQRHGFKALTMHTKTFPGMTQQQ